MGHRPEAVFARLTGAAVPIRPLGTGARTPPAPGRACALEPRRARGSDALPPISTGCAPGPDGLAEFIDAGPGRDPGRDRRRKGTTR
jgi:hypothetical protein